VLSKSPARGCDSASGLSSSETELVEATLLEEWEVGNVVARADSIGTRVKLRVLAAPGAVRGRCGRGVPHIPQNRLVAGLSELQLEQTKLPPHAKTIVTYAGF
jgi:hypothetical protein